MTLLQDVLDQKLLDQQLLGHRDVDDIDVIGTGPVMVAARDGCRIPAMALTRAHGQPGGPG